MREELPGFPLPTLNQKPRETNGNGEERNNKEKEEAEVLDTESTI